MCRWATRNTPPVRTPVTTAEVDGCVPTASGLVDTRRRATTGILGAQGGGISAACAAHQQNRAGQNTMGGDVRSSGLRAWSASRGGRRASFARRRWVSHRGAYRLGRPRAGPRRAGRDARSAGSRLRATAWRCSGAGSTTRRRWISMIPKAPLCWSTVQPSGELRQAVLAESDVPVVVAGMGGAGKSVFVAAPGQDGAGRVRSRVRGALAGGGRVGLGRPRAAGGRCPAGASSGAG